MVRCGRGLWGCVRTARRGRPTVRQGTARRRNPEKRSVMKKPAPGPILNRLRHSGLLLLILLLAAACSPGPAGNGGNDDGNGDGNGSPSGECFVHLYDGDNFDETDDNFRL